MGIKSLVQGNKDFIEYDFPKLKDQFDDLVKNGQKPEVFFIGCSDSRVLPTTMLRAKPGEMFILRNIGNFVPPYRNYSDFHGSSSAIEYAVSILNVKHIVICGHSYCGACAALYDESLDKDPKLKHISKWLTLGKKAKQYTLQAVKDKNDKDEILRTTEKISIIHQLENLLTYPAIYEKVKNNEIEIHGWYYKLQTGGIEYYDEKDCKFKILK
jgi:carbonic anhydrase